MAKRYGCTVCGYVYDEAKGIPEAGIAPGTQWEDLPTGWVCPVCGAPKDDFDEEDGLEKESSPAPEKEKPHPEDEADDLRELSFMEISAICSNLERSCEKQYKPEEALRFKALAKHYRERAGAAESADVNQILTLAEEDLDSGFPAANHAAEGDRGAGRALVWTEKVTRIAKSLLQRYEEQGEAMLEGTHVYLCTICGFIYIGDEPPPLCPVCKVPQWKFEKMEGR